MPRKLVPLLFFLLALPVPGCGGPVYERHAQVSLTVFVHDKDGFAWKDVEVRIKEAWNEWSACVCKGKEPWSKDYTDADGEVVFGPRELARSDIGFVENEAGAAVIGSFPDDDEAVIRLIVGDDSLGWVEIEVPINYHEPHVEVFVELN